MLVHVGDLIKLCNFVHFITITAFTECLKCVFDNFECSNGDAKNTKLMKLHAKRSSIAVIYSEKLSFNDE